MKFFAASRSRVNREGSFRPHVELLENRLQPGSMMTSGLGVPAVGAALTDLDSLDNTADLALTSHQRSLSDDSLSSGKMAVTLSQAPSTAPHSAAIHPASTSTPAGSTQANSLNQLPVANQQQAASAVARTATQAHTSASFSQAPVTAPGSANVHTQSLTQSRSDNSVTTVAATAQAVAIASVQHAPVSLTASDLKVVNSGQVHHGAGLQADIYVSYAPALDQGGPNEGHAIGVSSDSVSYATGQTVDVNGQQDVYIESTSQAGAANTIVLASASGNNLSGTSIVVTGDSVSGSLYVVGTSVDPTGATANSVFILNVTNDLTTVVAAAGLTGINGNISANGVALDNSGNVLVTGQGANASGGNDLYLIQLDPGLAGILGGVSFTFTLGDSSGHAVVADAEGNFEVGGVLTNSGTGENLGLFMQIDSLFSSAPWALAWNNPTPAAGPVGGAVNGVTISQTAAGEYLYMTGTLNGNSGGLDNNDMILAKVPTATGQPAGDPNAYAWNWGYHGTPTDTGDLGGTGIAVDSQGLAYTSASGSGDTTDYDGFMAQFDPSGSMLIGFIDYGNQTAGTTTTDRALGIAIDSSANPSAYLTGWTESDVPNDGFVITPNAARGTITAAGHDGWVAGASQPF